MQGRIDDQYAPGQHRPAATRRDLALAIGEVLAGQTGQRAPDRAGGLSFESGDARR